MCTFHPENQDPNLTCIMIGGNHIKYPGDMGTKTDYLDLFKIVIDSVFWKKGANYVTLNISNFYLQTPLEFPEYVHILLSDIPQEFIDKYNLLEHVRYGWFYFVIYYGVYGLPQLGAISNNFLENYLSNMVTANVTPRQAFGDTSDVLLSFS